MNVNVPPLPTTMQTRHCPSLQSIRTGNLVCVSRVPRNQLQMRIMLTMLRIHCPQNWRDRELSVLYPPACQQCNVSRYDVRVRISNIRLPFPSYSPNHIPRNVSRDPCTPSTHPLGSGHIEPTLLGSIPTLRL